MNTTIKQIAQAIKGTEFEGKVYIAGGFVRDYFMNRPSKDIDLVVEIERGGVALAHFLHRTLKTTRPQIFARFGTAQIVLDGNDIEMVMTRKESYNFKDRMPIVSYGTINDDVMRRDFTINSILYNISTESFVDLIGGIFDIEKKIIKTTSDPDTIFAEDPLRIMRAIRFASQLGFAIEDKTFEAIVKFVPWLKNISKERIRDEFNKILVAKNFTHGMQLLKSTGILTYMIPPFADLYKIANQGRYHIKGAWEHTLEVMKNSKPTVEARLAALLHDLGKGKTMTVDGDEIHFFGHQAVSKYYTNRFMLNYKYTNEQTDLVAKAVELHMNFIEGMLPKTIRKIVNEIGKDSFLFAIDLAEADSKHRDRIKIVNGIREFVLTDDYIPEVRMVMPVNGDMIMAKFNIKPSKTVGTLLDFEKELLFENPETSVDEIFDALTIKFNEMMEK